MEHDQLLAFKYNKANLLHHSNVASTHELKLLMGMHTVDRRKTEVGRRRVRAGHQLSRLIRQVTVLRNPWHCAWKIRWEGDRIERFESRFFFRMEREGNCQPPFSEETWGDVILPFFPQESWWWPWRCLWWWCLHYLPFQTDQIWLIGVGEEGDENEEVVSNPVKLNQAKEGRKQFITLKTDILHFYMILFLKCQLS